MQCRQIIFANITTMGATQYEQKDLGIPKIVGCQQSVK
jgi:hypothetical protein